MKEFANIKTVFLDIDDTLFDFKAGQKEAFIQTFEQMNYPCTKEIYVLYDKINEYFWKEFEKGTVTKEDLLWQRFEALYEKMGVNGDAFETELIYQKLLGNQAIWIDGAEDALKYLCGKYDVYVTTNGYGETQRNRVKKTGVDKLVKGLFISEIVGFQKPQKEYFDYCFNISNASRDTTVIIGDSLSSDMKGGINAGIKTIWFNYRNAVNNSLPIDITVNNWQEIYSIL